MLNEVTFTENTATNGGALYIKGFKLTVVDSTFDGNNAEVYGGALAIYDASNETIKCVITNTEFSGNNANSQGGAIYSSNSLIDFISGSFIANTSKVNGGAVSLYLGSVFNVTNLDAYLNESNLGGVIYVNRSTLYVNKEGTGVVNFGLHLEEGNEDLGNYALSEDKSIGKGGAIYSTINGEVYIYNASFKFNEAEYGGAIAASHDTGCEIYIYNSTFENNNANLGGAIYTEGKGCVYAYTSQFSLNTATSAGGAVCFTSTGNLICDSTFENNNAETYGGAVYIKGGQAEITLSTFTSNSILFSFASLIAFSFDLPLTFIGAKITFSKTFKLENKLKFW